LLNSANKQTNKQSENITSLQLASSGKVYVVDSCRHIFTMFQLLIFMWLTARSHKC